MANYRYCASKRLFTGSSLCPADFEKVIGAIVVPRGQVVDFGNLEVDCHASSDQRAFAIKTFVEFAKEGGETNVNAVGYGGNKVTGFSACTYTFTMENYDPQMAKGILNDMNGKYDVYFYDRKNVVYGMRNDEGELEGIPCSSIYPISTPHPTSSENATLQIAFAIKDFEKYLLNADFDEYSIDIDAEAMPLDRIKLVKVGATNDNTYRIVEETGGLDVTETIATLVGTTNLKDVFGAQSASYSATTGLMTITMTSGNPAPVAPATLRTLGVKGFEFV